MKTYNIFYMLLAFIIVACSKPEGGKNDGNNDNIGEDANYTILLSNNDLLSASLLNANLDQITLDLKSSPFGITDIPLLTYRDDTVISFYQNNPECTGIVTKYDFHDDSSHEKEVFMDLGDCDLSIKSIAHSKESIFIAYEVPGSSSKDTLYFIRTLNISNEDSSFLDLALENEPVQITFSNDRLFILAIDDAQPEKNTMVVMDAKANELLHEIDLGIDVQKITKNSSGNVVVSYEELHHVISSTTIATINTEVYNQETAPNFGNSESAFFDKNGNLYYQRPSETASSYENIPAIYDFNTNTTYLYLYENFLNTDQLQTEFAIGETSMVSYDAKNNLILIGYSKLGNINFGGLLRIKLGPEPKYLDNIDLEGVPYAVFVK